jgi:glutamate-1-semialdehyde 2,1-aminomutase
VPDELTSLRASHSGARPFGAAGRGAARAATGKRKILVASKAYQGSAPWCTPSPAGVTAEDRAHLIHFAYNDIASLEAAADAAGN